MVSFPCQEQLLISKRFGYVQRPLHIATVRARYPRILLSNTEVLNKCREHRHFFSMPGALRFYLLGEAYNSREPTSSSQPRLVHAVT